MIVLILIMKLQLASTHPTLVQADPRCENSPNAVIMADEGLMCVPSDLVYIGDFDE
jgi:hypothetical protein